MENEYLIKLWNVYKDTMNLHMEWQKKKDGNLSDLVHQINQINIKHDMNFCNEITELIRIGFITNFYGMDVSDAKKLYSDAWKFHKKTFIDLTEKSYSDYWENVTSELKTVFENHRYKFALKLLLIALDEIARVKQCVNTETDQYEKQE